MPFHPDFHTHSVFSSLRSFASDAFQSSSSADDCSPPCQHQGVCDFATLMCNCTSWYEGEACQSLKQGPRVFLVILLLVAILILLFYIKSRLDQKAKKELQVGSQDDPFVTSLNRIRQTESNQQMWVGDKFQSRDSYINSNSQKQERWWRPKLRYSPVAVDTATQ